MSNSEIKSYIYGIDPETFEIKSVSVTNDGKISISTANNPMGRTEQTHGKNPKDEVAIKFGLIRIFEVPIILLDSDSTKQRIKDLKELAADLKSQQNQSNNTTNNP